MPLVTAGVVDARLFDVALLADLGLDDASAPKDCRCWSSTPGRRAPSDQPCPKAPR